MVDIFGVLGEQERDPRGLGDELVGRGTGDSATYADERLALEVRYHPRLADDQPGRAAEGEVLTWVLGEIYGTETADGYRQRPEGRDSPDWLAALYASRGLDALSGLNGEFAAVIYDRRTGAAALVTDRLGSRPLFVARPAPGALAFASSAQRLACYPGVDPRLDGDLVAEYLAFKRTFGTATPLSGVERLPPATAATVDPATGERTDRRYWRPVFRPSDEPFERHVDRFVGTLRTVLAERAGGADGDVGLLLSGGTDSRALLAGADAEVTAYHLCDWHGRETRTARRAAEAADAAFVPLRRGLDHEVRSFESVGSRAEFTGWFSHAHAAGFERQLAVDCDVLLTGLYADTLFKSYSLGPPTLSLGPLGRFDLPLVREPETCEAFVDYLLDTADARPDEERLREILCARIRLTDDGRVVHHGVAYPSLREAFVSGSYFPLTNDADVLFLSSLREAAPTRTPYLDNRLLDLHLRYPLAYRVRRNLVGSALGRLSPDLAAIPHAETGVPPKYGFPAEYVGRNLNAFWWKHLSKDTPPAPHLTHHSWLDSAELIRQSGFVGQVLREDEALVRALPGVEWRRAVDWYRDHLDGADNTAALYGLLTLLSMPAVRRLAAARLSDRDDGATPRPVVGAVDPSGFVRGGASGDGGQAGRREATSVGCERRRAREDTSGGREAPPSGRGQSSGRREASGRGQSSAGPRGANRRNPDPRTLGDWLARIDATDADERS